MSVDLEIIEKGIINAHRNAVGYKSNKKRAVRLQQKKSTPPIAIEKNAPTNAIAFLIYPPSQQMGAKIHKSPCMTPEIDK